MRRRKNPARTRFLLPAALIAVLAAYFFILPAIESYLSPTAALLASSKNLASPTKSANGGTQEPPLGKQPTIQSLTSQILWASQKIRESPTTENRLLSDALEKSAELREKMMRSMIREEPEKFRLLSIASQRNSLQESILPRIEKNVEFEGTVEFVVEDNFDLGTSDFSINLKSIKDASETYSLRFKEMPPALKPGSIIRAKLIALGNDAVLVSEDSTGFQTESASQYPTAGEYRVLVIMMNFQDDQSQWITPSAMNGRLFANPDSNRNYYLETTGGRVAFSGDVYGWYTIPYDRSPCNHLEWSRAADEIVVQQGVNLNDYDRYMYVFPYTSACPWNGLAGGWRTWINGPVSYLVPAHELGHSLGLTHAKRIVCWPKAIDDYSRCTFYEYGDFYDVMGNSGYYHFNAPRKIFSGWIDAENIQTVAADGVYQIHSLEAGGQDTQALWLYKPDTHDYYFIEYRQPIGFDSSLPNYITAGASIHILPSFGGTYLVDATPQTPNNMDTSLSDGSVFEDENNGIQVRQLAHDATSVTVEVTFDNPPCVRSAPSIASGSYTIHGRPGDSRTHSLYITNNDLNCPVRIFNSSISVPDGWSSEFRYNNPAFIGFGQGMSTGWKVTSAADAIPGNYPVSINAAEVVEPFGSHPFEYTYVVDAPTVTPSPTPPPVTISITNPGNDEAINGVYPILVEAQSSNGIDYVEIFVDGARVSHLTSSPFQYSFDTPTVPNGVHSISARALDSQGYSATDSISVIVNNEAPPQSTLSLYPPNNAILSRMEDVVADVSGAFPPFMVYFAIDVNTMLGVVYQPPYIVTLDTRLYGDGPHRLSAVAFDSHGHYWSNTSDVVISNHDATPPSVSFASPLNGDVVSGTIAASVEAADNVRVRHVIFVLPDGSSLDDTPPYTASFDTFTVGEGYATLSAIAYDYSMNSNSASVDVFVRNPKPSSSVPPIEANEPG